MRFSEKSACAAPLETEAAPSKAENLLGEWRALLRQVGSPEIPPSPDFPGWTGTLNTLPALNQFLEDYVDKLLFPCELPAIVESCGHACRGEWRELLSQDFRLADAMRRTPFTQASRRMGRLQLARLRPLRDARIVQRYLAAVESSTAHGWHTIVYGVTLAVYSLPMRQGLQYYSQETISALASAAGRSFGLCELELAEMLSALLSRLPGAVAAALRGAESVAPVSEPFQKSG